MPDGEMGRRPRSDVDGRPDRARRARLITAILLCGLLGTWSVAAAARGTVEVEGETFGEFYDLGGLFIQVESCAHASGGYVADGIDLPGEWIELVTYLPMSRCFEDSIAVQADEDHIIDLRMTVFDYAHEDVMLTSDFTLVGAGIG